MPIDTMPSDDGTFILYDGEEDLTEAVYVHAESRYHHSGMLYESHIGTCTARQQPSAAPVSTRLDPYQLLGVSRGAKKEEIRSAYLQMMSLYHPDKVAHLAPEYQEIAKQKSQQINESYRQLTALK
jgi:DnaJ-domain-containing protein 1